jgi:hypothetical protein
MSDTNSSSPEQLTDSAGTVEAKMEAKIETVGLAQVEPAGELEVKPVAPIAADTPDQIIARLRKDLEDERTKIVGLSDLVEHLKLDRDLAKRERESAIGAKDAMVKRQGDMAAERDRWKAKAKSLETQVDGQKAEKLVAMIDERQRLRTEIGNKDAALADRQQLLEKAREALRDEERLRRAAEQRFQGIESTFEAMQAARNKAQQERGGALEDLASARKTIADIHAAAAGEKRAADASPLRDVKALREERDRLKVQVETLLENAKASTPAPARKGA